MKKIRLLWIGDSPSVSTGFGRVSQGVLEGLLATARYQVAILGINQPIGDPHRYEGMFRIYPAQSKGNVYGFNRVQEVIEKEQPQIIVINNDLWICQEYVKHIPAKNSVITYSPVDALPVQISWLDVLEGVGAKITTYTEFARTGILAAKQLKDDVEIVGHGVDVDEFYPIEDARSFMSGMANDAFIIQNVNRNQPRKRLDLYLKSAQIWLERLSKTDRESVCFYYHGAVKDVGYNLIDLAKRWNIDDRLMITDQKSITPASGVELRTLCKIYNCANVHVMTSVGEGYGLSPLESAACGVAQILPNHSACKELWENKAPLIDIASWDVLTGGINTEGGVIDVEHLADIYDDLYRNRDKLQTYAKLAYEYVQQEQFSWNYVAKRFDKMITSHLESGKLTKEFKQD